MKLRGIIWIFLFLFTGIVDSYASHIAGAEITYKHIIGNTYQFKLKVYRDCKECKFNNSGGGDNTTNCNDVPNLIIRGAVGTSYSSNQLGLIEIERKGIKDLTQACNSAVSKCRPGSNIPYGYEEHLFEGLFDFGTLLRDGYCKFDISVSIASRSVNINTMMSEQNFFNYAMLNLCESQPNESVQFTEIPQFIHILNQSNFNSLGIQNEDKDSLAFSLKPALVNRNLSITYAPGRSSDMPFNYYCTSGPPCLPNLSGNLVEGFYCSKSNGDIAFTPVQLNQGGVMAIECEEWKKNSNGVYFLAGVTRRDVYGDVVNSGNNLPVVRNRTLDFTICDDEVFTVEVNIDDVPLIGLQNDTVHAEIKTQMGGVVLEKIPTTTAPYFRYVLRVKPGQSQTGKHTVTLIAKDNHCPLNGRVTKTFTFNVLKARKVQIVSSVKDCGKFDVTSINFANRNLYWTIKDIQQNIIQQQLTRKLSVQLVSGGNYIVEVFLPAENGFCEIRQIDTIKVPDFKLPQIKMANDFKTCESNTINVQPLIFNTFNTYKLYVNGVILNQFPLEVLVNENKSLTFKVVQDDGCIAEDQINIGLFPQLDYKAKDDTVCVNDIFPSTVNNITVDKTKINILDYTYNSSDATIERVNANTWNLDLITHVAQSVQLFSLMQDKNNCIYLDTTSIHIIAPDPILVSCPDKVCINALPFLLQTEAGGKWECVNYPNLVQKNKLIMDSKSRGNLILKYTESRECVNAKTFNIQPMDTAILSFGHDKQIFLCENNSPYELKGLPSGGTWTGLHIEDVFFNPAEAAGSETTLKYTYKNEFNCLSAAAIKVKVEELPSLQVIADRARVCVGDVLELQAQTSVNNQGYWYTDGEGSFENPMSRITTYRPSENDVNKGPLKFSYTVQTNGVCGNLSSSATVSVRKGPSGDILKNYPKSVCEPAFLSFSSNYNRLEKQYWFINDSLAEEFDYNFDFNTVLKAGEYVIKTKVYDSTCEALSISDVITVLPKPQVRIGSNPSFKVSREYSRIYLKDLSYCSNGHSIKWYYNNEWINDSREFYYKADETKDSFYIKLVATSGIGSCKDSISQMFVFMPLNQLYIPDAFSPDSKGPDENNIFRVQGPEMREYEIEVFNKYGEKVFIADNMNQTWDGTYKNINCMPGVYFYKIITTDYDGISRDYSGTVTLIR